MPDRHVPSDGTDPEDRISAGAAADILGVHIDTVRRWTDSGYLPGAKVGPAGYRRFRRGDVQALADKHREIGQPA
jgi:excisionase family DNA binding protein